MWKLRQFTFSFNKVVIYFYCHHYLVPTFYEIRQIVEDIHPFKWLGISVRLQYIQESAWSKIYLLEFYIKYIYNISSFAEISVFRCQQIYQDEHLLGQYYTDCLLRFRIHYMFHHAVVSSNTFYFTTESMLYIFKPNYWKIKKQINIQSKQK